MNMTVEPRSKSISLPSKISLKDEDQAQNNKLNIQEMNENDKKPSMMSTTETTTLQKANHNTSIAIKREIYHSQNFRHSSIPSMNSTQEIDGMSQLEVSKDADVVVNISQLDLDRSVIREYHTSTDSDMLESSKRFGSEISFDKGTDNNKDKVDLIKKEEDKDDKSFRKWIIVFICIDASHYLLLIIYIVYIFFVLFFPKGKKSSSPSGTRTPVYSVKASYPNP